MLRHRDFSEDRDQDQVEAGIKLSRETHQLQFLELTGTKKWNLAARQRDSHEDETTQTTRGTGQPAGQSNSP